MENQDRNVEMHVDLDDIFLFDNNEVAEFDTDMVYEESSEKSNERSENGNAIPEAILNAAAAAKNECLPEKSRTRYYKALDGFEKWRSVNGVNVITEDVLLGYFHELSGKFKPSSLWSYYSMLKGTIRLNFGVDIASFSQLTIFLKKKNKGYKPRQAHVFTELARFIVEASDREWFDVKAISIFGVCGALRGCEIMHFTLKDVERQGNLLLVRVLDTKTATDRSFTIPGVFCSIVEQYAALRSPATTTDRFFVNYVNGKCTVQPIGKNKISKMPSRIAAYLSLQEPERYTGHTLRRTGATIFINAGSSMESLKRFVTWRSAAVAESYVADSFYRQKKDGQTITSAILNSMPSSSSAAAAEATLNNHSQRDGQTIAIVNSSVAASKDHSNEVARATPANRIRLDAGAPLALSDIHTAEVISQTHTVVRTTGTVSMAQTNDAANTNNDGSVVESNNVVSAGQIQDALSENTVDTNFANALRNGLFAFGSLSGCTFNVHLK